MSNKQPYEDAHKMGDFFINRIYSIDQHKINYFFLMLTYVYVPFISRPYQTTSSILMCAFVFLVLVLCLAVANVDFCGNVDCTGERENLKVSKIRTTIKVRMHLHILILETKNFIDKKKILPKFPSKPPTKNPTKTPSKTPTKSPTKGPTKSPTNFPSTLSTILLICSVCTWNS